MTRHGLAEAEAIAWPLLDPASWRAARTELPTAQRHQAFARRLSRVDATRDATTLAARLWSPTDSVLAHLRRHARRLLRPGAERAELIEDPRAPGTELQRWRWMSLLLPAHLLSVAATPSGEAPLWGVRLLRRGSGPRGPVAHQHLHAGATYGFETIWAAMAAHFEGIDARDSAPAGLDGVQWESHLLAAHLLRRELAARWLGRRSRPGEAVVREAARHLADPTHGPIPMERERWRSALWRPLPTNAWSSVDQLLAHDPIGDGAPRWHEADLLQEGFDRAERGNLGPHEERAFVQYLRVKVCLFRHLVMDVAERGLGSFVHVYKRISTYKGRLRGTQLEQSSPTGALDIGSVMLRTAPSTDVGELLDLATVPRSAAQRGAGSSPLEWGWVLHFIRNTPAIEGTPVLYTRWRQHLAQARTLERALTRWPQLLRVFRGLDVAGQESEGPLWLDLPLLHRLRAHATRVARTSRLPGLDGLRVTVHAGEEFISPLTGLRRIEEVLRGGLARRGDRIGHALALGLPLETATPDGRREQRARERLLDVAWMLTCAAEGRSSLSGSRQAALTDELRALGGQVLGLPDADALLAMYAALWSPRTLPLLGIEQGAQPQDLTGVYRDVLRLVSSWDRPRATAPVELYPEDERDLAIAHQEDLRRRLARMQITVELNPSSNLVIAGFENLVDQPMFKLRPVDDGPELVEVTLSADDPLSFATSLEDEFAYVWAALVQDPDEQGKRRSAASVTRWCQEVADASWRTRFTDPTTREPHSLGKPPQSALPRLWRRHP